MSPRPRRVSDEQLFAATQAVMEKVGPGELTLAAIARQAGVTAAVLVQRFGSKRALLLAIYERFAAGSGEMIAALRRQHRSPLAAVRGYAACMADMAASPAACARNLAYLQIDLTDPEFRRYLARHARATRAGLARLLAEAVGAGELKKDADPKELARTVETVISGSLLTWAIYQEGRAAPWMRRDVEAVLRPWLSSKSSSKLQVPSSKRGRG
jgi:AcrR family transcriptional regulator